MLNISSSLRAQFSAYLQEKVIPKNNQAVYQKWLRYYLDSRFHGNDVWRRNFLRSYSKFLQLIEMIGGFRGLFFCLVHGILEWWNIGMTFRGSYTLINLPVKRDFANKPLHLVNHSENLVPNI